MMVKMLELSKADQLGFRSAAWDFTNLGKCDGFCEQEIAMANLTKTRYYILSSGLKVVRAFAKCNFLFYNKKMGFEKEVLTAAPDGADIVKGREVTVHCTG